MAKVSPFSKTTEVINGRNLRRQLEREVLKGNKLGTSNNYIISLIKNNFSSIQMKRAFENLPQAKLEMLYANFVCSEYENLGNLAFAFSENLSAELRWAKHLFNKFSHNINLFLQYKNSIEKLIVLGNYDAAETEIYELQSSAGVSLWSIEKLFFLNENKKIKDRTLLYEILAKCKSPLFKLITYFTSLKVENSLSFHSYEEQILEYINKQPDEKIKDFLKYKLLFFKTPVHDNLHTVASYEGGLSLFDYYETLISCLIQHSTNSVIEKNEKAFIKEFLTETIAKIKDPRLENLIRLHDNEHSNLEFEEQDVAIVSTYLEGNYHQCIELLDKALIESPMVFDYYYLYTRCLLVLEKDFLSPFINHSISNQLLLDIYDIQKCNDRINTIVAKFQKRVYSLGASELSIPYYFFIFNEIPRASYKWQDLKYLTQSKGLLDLLYAFDAQLKFSIKNATDLTQILNDVQTLAYDGNVVQIVEQSLKNNEIGLIASKILFRNKQFEKCQTLVDELRQHQVFNQPIYNDLILYKKEILFQSNNFIAASSYVVTRILENENLLYKLYDEGLYQILFHSYDDDIQSSIDTIIFLHLMLGAGELSELWIPFDNYLSWNNLTHPSELISLRGKVEANKLIYVMKNICVKEVYDSSWQYNDQDDLDNERIRVLKGLEILDITNKGLYKAEIGVVERDIQVRKALKQIDESKIYVNTKLIKNKLNEKLSENLVRFKEMQHTPPKLLELIESTCTILFIGSENDEGAKLQYEVEEILVKYKDPRYTVFKSTFLSIRDEFISSSEHGIDSYLSMRVRHGTLLGQIRSIFEKYFLITKKDGHSGNYQVNMHWLNKFLCDQNQVTSVNRYFSEFSESIDIIADDLRRKYLQIYIEGKPTEALFDFAYSDDSLYLMYKETFNSINDAEEFFNKALEILWQRTDKILELVRNYITENITRDLTQSTWKLKDKVDLLLDTRLDERPFKEFHSSITNCTTDIANELKKISDWFQRSSDKNIDSFTLDMPININLRMIGSRSADLTAFYPEIINECDLKFDGEYLSQFTDLFKNLFDNILEHSQLPPILLKVKLRASNQSGYLQIHISNNFSPNIDLEDLNISIAEIRKQLNTISDINRSGKEGKTGYLKVQKIIKNDFNCRGDYSVTIDNVTESRIFQTEIKFTCSNILYK